MSSTQLTPLGMTDESLKELLLDLIPGDGHDYTANFLWKDELEFQEVLYYWSSRFRAIHLAKLLTPVAEEFKSSWELYYAAEVVSFICRAQFTNLIAFRASWSLLSAWQPLRIIS